MCSICGGTFCQGACGTGSFTLSPSTYTTTYTVNTTNTNTATGAYYVPGYGIGSIGGLCGYGAIGVAGTSTGTNGYGIYGIGTGLNYGYSAFSCYSHRY